ncbi:MAG: P-II family nitrogen regulator [Ghiorsea sp.]
MYKLITCIAAEDKATEVVQGLADNFAIQATIYYFARGFGRSASLAARGMGQQTEKATIKVMVETERADEVFAYIFQTADLNRPHGGIVYVNAVQKLKISPPVKPENVIKSIDAPK